MKLSEGQTAINIHIPRMGTHLCHDKVLRAYGPARDFFRNTFLGGKTPPALAFSS